MRLRTGLLSMAAVLVLQVFLVQFHVYGRWEWIDVPVHMLGGFVVGMIAAGLITYAKASNRPLWFNFIFTSAVVVMVGAGWEILEYVFYNSSQTGASIIGEGLTVRDLLGDLINDGIGGVVAWFLFIRKLD